MNYKLCIKRKTDKEVRILDMSGVFTNKKDGFNLEILDKFTSQFKEENELKTYLLAKKIISADEYCDDVQITYGNKIVRYAPVMYANANEFNNLMKLSKEIKGYFDYRKDVCISTESYDSILDNYRNITDYFSVFETISRSKQFLNLIVAYVKNNPNQETIIDDINLFLHQDFGTPKCKQLYIALFELFRREFFDYKKETKELKFTYKGFRDFCIFYFDYKKKNFVNNNLSVQENDYYDGEQMMFKGYK